MKRVLIFLIIICSIRSFERIIYSQNNEIPSNIVKMYLDNYFKTKTYSILGDNFKFGSKYFIIAVQYARCNTSYVNKGIVIENNEDEIFPHLYFDEEIVLNGAKKVILNLSKNHTNLLTFCGWRLKYVTKKKKENEAAIMVSPLYKENNGRDFYFDSIIIQWDNEKNVFQKYFEDPFASSPSKKNK